MLFILLTRNSLSMQYIPEFISLIDFSSSLASDSSTIFFALFLFLIILPYPDGFLTSAVIKPRVELFFVTESINLSISFLSISGTSPGIIIK